MPRRKTLAELMARGAIQRNPARYRDRIDNLQPEQHDNPPLGEPTVGLSEEARERFLHLREHCPWLRRSDTCLVEVASVLSARLMDDWNEKGFRELLRLLKELGATPLSRGDIGVASDP